jgi:glycerol-3-phosphate dehydrogenase subunit B
MTGAEHVDLLVIGGGMGGSIAAAAAAAHGLSVVLIRKGYGATALSSGAIDFGPEQMSDSLVGDALAFFLDGMNGAGYPYTGEVGRTVELLTMLGTIKRTQLYPASAAPGLLTRIAGGKMLFIGIKGLAEYNAAHVARATQALFQRSVVDESSASCEMEFPGVRHTHNVLGFELAQLLDEREIVEQFAKIIKQVAEGYSHVALPPIIGLDRPQEAFKTIAETCPSCFELLSAPPSVLGLRLQTALGRWVQRQARIVHGIVTYVEKGDGHIRNVRVVDRDTEYQFEPQAVVLATGRFIGGGLAYEQGFRETVLGLPLWFGGNLVSDQTLDDLSVEAFASEQPFMTVGLRTGEDLRPLDADGHVAYRNVFAAGALLQGCDYQTGRGGLGAALLSGYRIGKWISEQG